MTTIRERCKHCGRLHEWQTQRTLSGQDEYVAVVPRVCPVRSMAPHAPSNLCECETRADRMAASAKKRIARKYGVRGRLR
jgi:hypothetical protein